MLKSVALPLVAIGAVWAGLTSAESMAAPIGPHAALCAAGKPSVLVRVPKVKTPRGSIEVKLYASNSSFLDKGKYLQKVEVPVRGLGPFDICVPVPQANGRYMVSVRHEVGANKSRSDGGGFSGNPRMSLIDIALKRKPSLSAVTFQVNGKTRIVPVTMHYIQGTSLQPVS